MKFQLAGLSFRPREAKLCVADMREGTTVTLVVEPDNRFDPFAVRVIDDDTSIFIGYVPRTGSQEVSEKLVRLGFNAYRCHLTEADPKTPVFTLEWLDDETEL